ncbi:MAG: hypothetical protein AAB288_11550, partial [Acidobacteriota bacterium]
MPFNQFIGLLADQDGKITEYAYASGGGPAQGNRVSVRNSGQHADKFVATVSKVLPNGSIGGVVFELAGHNYARRDDSIPGSEESDSELAMLNGQRMALNSIFVPARGTPPCTSILAIDSINPTSPIVGGEDQNIVVYGSGFLPGLTTLISFPTGQSATLSGTQIQDVTETSFRMRVTLGAPGSWSIRVSNPNGGLSDEFPFTVQPIIQTPRVFSINPETPVSSAADQDIFVSGANFKPGLTVDIVFPGGGGTTLSGAQIQNITDTSFIMRATLGGPGAWSIKVKNTDNQESSLFSFNVLSSIGNPYVNSINPTTPIEGGADQNVVVHG